MKQFILREKDLGFMVVWELNPEGLGSFWLKACATWCGHSCWRPSFRDSLDCPADHYSFSVNCGWLQVVFGRHKCFPSCRTKGFPASANFESKLSDNLVGEEWNPQILENFSVTNAPRWEDTWIVTLEVSGHGCGQRTSRSGMHSSS
jgi:hypothetical protein